MLGIIKTYMSLSELAEDGEKTRGYFIRSREHDWIKGVSLWETGSAGCAKEWLRFFDLSGFSDKSKMICPAVTLGSLRA